MSHKCVCYFIVSCPVWQKEKKKSRSISRCANDPSKEPHILHREIVRGPSQSKPQRARATGANPNVWRLRMRERESERTREKGNIRWCVYRHCQAWASSLGSWGARWRGGADTSELNCAIRHVRSTASLLIYKLFHFLLSVPRSV